MYTRCPTCSTCFRVTDRHLAIANGKVRCGQCQLVFNAPQHAIDDLPVNQLTTKTPRQPIPPVTHVAPITSPAKKVEIKKPEPTPPKKKVEPAVMAQTAKEKAAIKQPSFDAASTMIADINSLDKNDLDNIDLDDVFNNDVDLDAAIDQLTKATEDAVKEDDLDSLDEEIEESDIFSTDAYDATNASSVASIMAEMEGQLSLDISGPEQTINNEAEYDANNEFDFIQLDDENSDSIVIEEESETNDDTLKNHFNLDEFGIDDELTESVEEKPNEIFEDDLEDDFSDLDAPKEKSIDEDELFDQVDLSDFQDSKVEENSNLKEEPYVDSEFAFDNFEKDNSTHDSDDANVPFQLRNDIKRLQVPSHRRIHPLITFSFVIILLLLSFSQFAYFRSHELVKLIPQSRPLLVQFCEKVGCRYSGPTDKKKIQLISRDVRLHPKEKKVLLISAAMINNAHFAQPYPNIHIRLSDISGNVIAERIFTAKTYMGKLSNPFLLMKSKTPVHINFEVVDPGKDAINFEFTFL